MILKTKDFQSVCKKILFAIDSKDTSLITETLELRAKGINLDLNITNREYFVTTKFLLTTEEDFVASVNASLFLNLISKVTTDVIEITKDNNSIKIKANGEYKLPMIFNNDQLLELPKIEVNNITNEMDINSSVLYSVAIYNSKELLRNVCIKNPVQKYYYIDELGAITFTSGACVNSFNLEKPVKVLLNDKVVKLFKLFAEDSKVHFVMGHDAVTEEITHTKVRFSTDNVIITAKLTDSSLISSVPVTAIRNMANNTYNHSVVINKDSLLSALNRLLLFSLDNTCGTFEFNSTTCTIYDSSRDNKEVVMLNNECRDLSYSFIIDLSNFKLVLDGVEDEFITMNFGDKKAVIVKKNNISNIIPEMRLGTQ